MTQPARRPQPARKRWQPAMNGLAAVVASILVLTGCQLVEPDATGPASAPPEVIGDVASELEPYYAQEVVWKECKDDFTCTTVEVPLDYDNPDGERIELAVIRSTTGGAQGSILLNPGGPGGSGYESVSQSLDAMASEALRSEYNIVGFDPRGVGRSTPVKCLPDSERDAYRAETFDLETPEGVAAATKASQDFAKQCAKNSGALLGHVDTESAARDLDILRAIVGDKKLNYLGFSYGTFLGTTYAELFPETVGRMVLDGGINPANTSEEMTMGQAKGFEDAIRAYVADCQTSNKCPLPGTVDDGVAKIRALIESVEESPMMSSSGREVTVPLFVSGFILPLYNDANWPTLTQALSEALRGNPDTLLYLADFGADREEDGSYSSNSNFAFNAINCLDYPMPDSLEAMRADAAALDKASPTLGRFLAYGGILCDAWPHDPVREPHKVAASGAAPIVVVGTTGDPATPYQWSKELAEQLESGVLLTWEGQGHTAYGRAGDCIGDAVDNYFVEGTVPEDGTHC